MDALGEILRVVKLDSAIFLNGEFSEPWCIASPQSRSLAPLFDAAAGHVIIYHLLCKGRATVHMEDGTRVALVPGDLITFPHGHSHLIGSGPRVEPVEATSALPQVLDRGLELMQLGGGGACSHFICGYLICDPQLCQAFIGGLPSLIKVSIRDDAAGQWLESGGCGWERARSPPQATRSRRLLWTPAMSRRPRSIAHSSASLECRRHAIARRRQAND